jgi:hypothetical protein
MKRQDIKDSLEKDLNEGVAKLSLAVNNLLEREVTMILTRPDKFRVLNFISWVERYHVSLKEMLGILLPIWRKKFQTNSKGLGVRLSLLVGPKSKEIIKQYIKKAYPNGENLLLSKQSISDKYLSKMNSIEVDDPVEYIQAYKDNIISIRKEDTKMKKQMRRRSWRGNPFI